MIEIINGEKGYTSGTNTRKTNFPTQSTLDRGVVFHFCYDNRGPDGRDIQAGLTDRMV
jgi:hypothetical protein